MGGGAIQWVDFFLVNNEKAGIEMKLIMGDYEPYSETHGAMIKGGHIVAYDTSGMCTIVAINVTYIMQECVHHSECFHIFVP